MKTEVKKVRPSDAISALKEYNENVVYLIITLRQILPMIKNESILSILNPAFKNVYKFFDEDE